MAEPSAAATQVPAARGPFAARLALKLVGEALGSKCEQVVKCLIDHGVQQVRAVGGAACRFEARHLHCRAAVAMATLSIAQLACQPATAPCHPPSQPHCSTAPVSQYGDLVRHSGLPPGQLRAALLMLVQHNYVNCYLKQASTCCPAFTLPATRPEQGGGGAAAGQSSPRSPSALQQVPACRALPRSHQRQRRTAGQQLLHWSPSSPPTPPTPTPLPNLPNQAGATHAAGPWAGIHFVRGRAVTHPANPAVRSPPLLGRNRCAACLALPAPLRRAAPCVRATRPPVSSRDSPGPPTHRPLPRCACPPQGASLPHPHR